MAQRANIVINDGQTTPVAHTFNPNSGDGNVPGTSMISYEDRSGGISVGFPTVMFITRKPNKQLRNTKVTLIVKRPVLEVLSNSTVSGIMPAPTVAYEVTFRAEFTLPERSDLAARKDILAYARNLLANAAVTSAIQDLEAPW